MQTSASPVTKPLFLAMHPPRRFWPDLAGFYVSPAQARPAAQKAQKTS